MSHFAWGLLLSQFKITKKVFLGPSAPHNVTITQSGQYEN